MRKFKKYAVCFATGGLGYAIIELLYRHHTHWTMIIAGGICFIIFSLVAEKCGDKPLYYKATLCSVSVTAVELIFGIIFNLILKMNIWDYSNNRFNFLGQICPFFMLIWGVLGIVFLPLAAAINKLLSYPAERSGG